MAPDTWSHPASTLRLNSHFLKATSSIQALSTPWWVLFPRRIFSAPQTSLHAKGGWEGNPVPLPLNLPQCPLSLLYANNNTRK